MISPSIAYAADEERELRSLKEAEEIQRKTADFMSEISSRSPAHVRHLLAVADRDAFVFRAVTLALSVALGNKAAPSWELAEMRRAFRYCAHVVLEESDDE